MKSITSKVSYLSGLVDGLEIDNKSKEGKAILEIISVLKDMAMEIRDLNDATEDLEEYVVDLDEDLAYVEEELFDEDYEDEYEDFEDENFIDLECDKCGEVVYIDKDILDDKEKVTCPNCHSNMNTEADNK